MENTTISTNITNSPLISSGPFLINDSNDSISGVIIVGIGKTLENSNISEKDKSNEKNELKELYEIIEENT